MEVGLHYNDITNAHRLQYVLDFITNHPLNSNNICFTVNEKQDTNLYYTSETPIFGIHIRPQKLFFENQLKRTLYANSYLHNDQVIYSVEDEKRGEEKFSEDKIIRFDIFETIFFHISRLEEVNPTKELLNDRDQVKESELFSVKHGIEKSPVVDHLVLAFLQTIDPRTESQKTKYKLTHDIDFIKKFKSPLSYIRQSFGAMIRGNFLSLSKQYFKMAFSQSKDPYDNFDFLLSDATIDKTIFFLVGGTHKYDNHYDLNDPIFVNAIELSKKRGYNLGIHPSYESWTSAVKIEEEIEKLSKAINYNIEQSRQHYLHFDIKETPTLLLKAGIEEDFSIGYTNRIGFKCGTGFPYYLYDFKAEKTSDLKEIPLVLMDSAAINEAKATQSVLEDLIEGFLLTNMENTCVTFNFHNSRFDETLPTNKSLSIIYKKIKERF